MIKRVTAVGAIGLVAALTVPSLAVAQEGEGDPEETSGTTPESVVTEPEPVVEPEPAVTEEVTEEEETGDTTTEEVANTESSDSEAATDASTAVEPSTVTTEPTSAVSPTMATTSDTSSTSGKKKKARISRKGKKGKKSGKKCSTSSRAAGPLAQAAGPPAPGCTRLDAANGVLVLPDGTTLTITETSQGVIEFTVSGGPTGTFTGTIFVKGGPDDPGNACVFTTPVSGGTCNAPLNPNSGKLYGVSHVDACPGTFTQPGPGGGSTPGTQGGQRREEERRQEQQKREKVAAERPVSGPVAVAAVPAPGGLPVTGLPVIWLVLAGGSLLAGGLTLRRLT